MLIINNWTGRIGNNILQLIRAIHYAIENKHRIIIFNSHKLLSSQKIIINNEVCNDMKICDTFFSLSKFNLKDPSPYVMKQYFHRYISPIFLIKIGNASLDDTSIYVHFRGGDIFSSNPHKAYVQPPLSYYKNIIDDYENAILVCEDNKNPCINELLKQENIEFTSNTLEKDLSILSNVSNLVIGFGTFGFLLYLMNPYLKNLYIPDYFINELPEGEWGNELNLNIINLPNYIKVGEWKNSVEQRIFMINY